MLQVAAGPGRNQTDKGERSDPSWHFWVKINWTLGFPGGARGKESTCQCRRCKNTGFISWLGRSPGKGNGNPLQYSCLENSMERGARQTTVQFSSVQLLSHVRLFATPWTAAHQASLSITNSQSLLKLISIKLVTPSNYLIFCCSLLLLTSLFPRIRVFSKESVFCTRWPKYWNFSFSISPSNEYLGLISFRIDWFDLLAVQETANITTGKTIALTRQTFVGKVISLFYNMLSRLVITFLPRTKRLLISWLQSPSSVNLEPKK